MYCSHFQCFYSLAQFQGMPCLAQVAFQQHHFGFKGWAFSCGPFPKQDTPTCPKVPYNTNNKHSTATGIKNTRKGPTSRKKTDLIERLLENKAKHADHV